MISDWQIQIWEKEWQTLEPRLSEREWLEVFPESRNYSEHKLESYKKETQGLASEIRKDLQQLYKKNIGDEFSVWFGEEIIRVWKGERLDWLDKSIRKLEWLLIPEKEKKGSGITDALIERAKEFSFRELVESKRDFLICPFHSERRPSFWIKNNWGFCFGCGWHGDTIKFLINKYQMSFQEAVKRLS